MEILNQKAERMQAKKDVEITREITEKIKNELKIHGGSSESGSSVINHYHMSDPKDH
jgi:hypothetical protein